MEEFLWKKLLFHVLFIAQNKLDHSNFISTILSTINNVEKQSAIYQKESPKEDLQRL